jgi:hypothetical protein
MNNLFWDYYFCEKFTYETLFAVVNAFLDVIFLIPAKRPFIITGLTIILLIAVILK